MNQLPGIPSFGDRLRIWKPTTPDDAAQALKLISDVKVAEKPIKKSCYQVIEAAAGDEKTFTTEGGILLKKVTVNKKLFNDSPEIALAQAELKKAEAEVKKWKKKLEDAQNAAGFELKDNYSYWQVGDEEPQTDEE